jgi:hypothetical protein
MSPNPEVPKTKSKDQRHRSVNSEKGISTRPNLYIYQHFRNVNSQSKTISNNGPQSSISASIIPLLLHHSNFRLLPLCNVVPYPLHRSFHPQRANSILYPRKCNDSLSTRPVDIYVKGSSCFDGGRTNCCVGVCIVSCTGNGFGFWHACFGPWVLGQYIASFTFHGAWMTSGIVALAGY